MANEARKAITALEQGIGVNADFAVKSLDAMLARMAKLKRKVSK